MQVTLTFKNTSDITWNVTDGYTLGSALPAGNTTWGISSIPLPVTVDPGASVTFTFFVIVPSTVGTYNFQWQMVSPAAIAFGSVSPATAVQVIAPGPANYEGLWWANPAGSESGWGINFAHQGDTIFATWFTYDLTGKSLVVEHDRSADFNEHIHRHAVPADRAAIQCGTVPSESGE